MTMTTTTTKCKHTETVSGEPRCYSGAVSRDENRAAHGGITVTRRCLTCGAERSENRNGGHEEIGEWGPSAAERDADLRAAIARANRHGAPGVIEVAPDGEIIIGGSDRISPLDVSAGSVEIHGCRLDRWAGWRDACLAASLAR
jgi:hypothetical protein